MRGLLSPFPFFFFLTLILFYFSGERGELDERCGSGYEISQHVSGYRDVSGNFLSLGYDISLDEHGIVLRCNSH